MHAFKALGALAVLAAPVFGQAKFQPGQANPNAAGVVGSNSNGPTNPRTARLGTPVNQTSEARLLSVNSIDDWCTFGPMTPEPIGNIEAIVVAYCTKARNNARVIPDGTLTAVHFIKTATYVQVAALGDFTRINLVAGDQGGELDPHGATNMGNPVGGNVTSNVSGQDVFYEEWMNFVSSDMVCIRVCTAATNSVTTGLQCLHTLDEMGCRWVMPGDYTDNVFDSCEADVAYPPGIFPQPDGSTSTFQQYFSSVFTAPGGGVQTFINGSPDQATPTAAYSLPASSNCVPTSTIANGIKEILPTTSSSSSSVATSSGSSTTGRGGSTTTRPSSATGTNTPGAAAALAPSAAYASIFALGSALIAAIVAL